MASAYIAFTHLVGAAKKPIYVKKDQIVAISDPQPGTDTRYRTTLVLSSGPQSVLETIEQVLAQIEHAGMTS